MLNKKRIHGFVPKRDYLFKSSAYFWYFPVEQVLKQLLSFTFQSKFWEIGVNKDITTKINVSSRILID